MPKVSAEIDIKKKEEAAMRKRYDNAGQYLGNVHPITRYDKVEKKKEENAGG